MSKNVDKQQYNIQCFIKRNENLGGRCFILIKVTMHKTKTKKIVMVLKLTLIMQNIFHLISG